MDAGRESVSRNSTRPSYFHDFQTRRLNIRYRDMDGTLKFAHSLNNTALALTRFIAVLVENYQQADGTIKVPEVLVPYVGKGKSWDIQPSKRRASGAVERRAEDRAAAAQSASQRSSPTRSVYATQRAQSRPVALQHTAAPQRQATRSQQKIRSSSLKTCTCAARIHHENHESKHASQLPAAIEKINQQDAMSHLRDCRRRARRRNILAAIVLLLLIVGGAFASLWWTGIRVGNHCGVWTRLRSYEDYCCRRYGRNISFCNFLVTRYSFYLKIKSVLIF